MAKRTYVELTNRVEEFLQDSTNVLFTADEIQSMFTDILYRIASYKLVITRHSLTTIADSKELQIATIDDLIDPLYAEYTVDKNPRNFRNIIRRGNLVELDINIKPTAGETAYLYCKKPHRINQMTDLAGAIDLPGDTYAAGDTTIHVDGLETSVTIPVDTEFTIAGIGGVYRLTAAATISSNEGDLTFFPGLAAAAADGIVVTFEQSTLDGLLEDLFINFVAARVAISKSSKYLQQINTALTAMLAVNTALDLVAAKALRQVTDVASGRTAAGLAAAVIIEANLELDKMSTEIALANTALDSANTVTNTVTKGGPNVPGQYAGEAQQRLGTAQGYLGTARGFLAQAASEGPLAATYAQLGAAELQGAVGSINEATGYIQEVTAEFNLARLGSGTMRQWGTALLRDTIAELKAIQEIPEHFWQEYPKD